MRSRVRDLPKRLEVARAGSGSSADPPGKLPSLEAAVYERVAAAAKKREDLRSGWKAEDPLSASAAVLGTDSELGKVLARAPRRRRSAFSLESSGSDGEEDRRRTKSRRVLARHQKEVSWSSRGERLECLSASQPWAVAVAWLLTVYVNQYSPKRLGPRTMRELRALCHTLDFLV